MFTPIADLPDSVVGFTASGKIDDDDYKQTLIPAVKDLISRAGKVRVILVPGPEWEGYSAAAMFDDAKLDAAKAWVAG